MATFVLLPGAGSGPWYWHLVGPQLEAAGHDVVAVDLPVDDEDAGLGEYADVTLNAVGDRTDVVLVAQSMGAFTAGLVAARVPVDLVVLVAAMAPSPGESAGEWWANTGQAKAARKLALQEDRDPDAEYDPFELFLHDVPHPIAVESAAHTRDQAARPFQDPWPLPAWPSVPTRFLLCRQDRLFPAAFQRRVVRQRLGITPDEMDSGHLPALSQPRELARRLLDYHAGRPNSGHSSPSWPGRSTKVPRGAWTRASRST